MTTVLAIEIFGWAGAGLILIGYALLTAGKLTAQQPVFHLMNAVGSVGLIANAVWNGALPSAGLNIVWLLIALIALIRLLNAGPRQAKAG